MMQRHPVIQFAWAWLWLSAAIATAPAEDWPCWRGPRGDGSSEETGVPVRWSPTENVAWKVELPGWGHASAIVHGDRVWTVAADEATLARLLLCHDRRTGRELWRREVLRSPLEDKHALNSYASGTPACDGQRVYCTFLDGDEMVVAAFDLNGEPQWQVRPGPFHSKHGYCSCPVVYEDLLIVNGDHDGDSYLVALRREDGAEVWKTPRENNTRSYVTPIVRTIDGRTQLVLSGSKCVSSYDPRNGQRHWYIDGPTEQFVASMVYHRGLFFLTAGFPEYHMLAIRPDGSGNVTDTHIAWRHTKGAGYVPSPVAAGDYFLVVTDGGVASCLECVTGQRMWTERLGTHYSGSLIAAEGLVYFTDDKGITKIVRPGPQLEVTAENDLGEACFSSPAVSQGQIFFRGEKHLIAIGPREIAQAGGE